MQRTFLYHAHASGVSGEITLPFKEVIEVQAPGAIPVTGGYSSSRVENFKYRDILSFKLAATVVTGSFSEADQAYDTLMTSTVENLDILGVVTVDRLVARLTSRHPKDGGEPSIIPLGSHFDNLRVAGCKVDVHIDSERFVKFAKYQEVRQAMNTDADFRAQMSRGGVDLSAQPANSILLCSLVKQISVHCPELKPSGHSIQVPQFGTVYLGEYLLTPYSRSITMLRVVLGCSIEGMFTASAGSGNGEPFPP